MGKEQESTAGNDLVQSSGQALARRSDALVVRGIRDIAVAERLPAMAEFERGLECAVRAWGNERRAERSAAAESLAQAVVHYRKASELGHAQAQYNLGEMYLTGRGVKQNPQEAARWFAIIREAAERGDGEAQASFALMYSNGLGVEHDDTKAAHWWRRAAEQRVARAESCLAGSYHAGSGVPEDHEEEEHWFRKASAHGDANAAMELGLMHTDVRKCVPSKKDLAKAYMWFRVAAFLGSPRGQRGCGKVGKELSPSQIAEAEQLAKEWYADNVASFIQTQPAL
jgi:TPR repeat protein